MKLTEHGWSLGSIGEEVQTHVKRCRRTMRRLIVARYAVYAVVLTELFFRPGQRVLLASILTLLVLLPIVLFWKLAEERRLRRILACWHEQVRQAKAQASAESTDNVTGSQ